MRIDSKTKDRIEKKMNEMKEMLNKDLDEKVANNEIDEHQARDHYFHMMTITFMIAR